MTLAVTVVATSGWVRSYSIKDEVILRDSTLIHFISSAGGNLRWESIMNPSAMEDTTVFPTGWRTWPVEAADAIDEYEDFDIEWRWQTLGFDFGRGAIYRQKVVFLSKSMWIVPYWAISWPLTLLSSTLIVWTYRQPRRIQTLPGGDGEGEHSGGTGGRRGPLV